MKHHYPLNPNYTLESFKFSKRPYTKLLRIPHTYFGLELSNKHNIRHINTNIECNDKSSYQYLDKIVFISIINPKYAIEITKLAKVIAPWAFTNNHRLTFGLTSDSLQTLTVQALSLISAILLHNLG